MPIGKKFKDLVVTTDIDGLLGAAENSDGTTLGNKFVYTKTPNQATPSDAKVLTEKAVIGITQYSGTTTITVGGIAAGTTLTNDPISNIVDQILRPYINPSFTTFAITGVSTLEVGHKITGSQTFTWAISDPTHAAANSVNITDVTNSLSLVTAHSVTSPATYDFNGYAGGGLEYDTPSSNIWQIQATDTNAPPATFNRTHTANWYWLLHYGTSTNTSLDQTQIKALVSSILTPTTARTYSFAAGGYKYICANEDLPLLTTFKDSSTQNDIPFETPVTVSVTNVNSITSNYKLYRSTNILGAAISIIAS